MALCASGTPITNPTMNRMRTIEDQAFLWLVVGVTLAFAVIVWPYFGAVLWGVVVAIIVDPLHRKLVGLTGQREGLAAIITVLLVILLAVVPLIAITSSLVAEATGLYERIQSGQLNLADISASLPAWVHSLLDRFGLNSFEEIRGRVSSVFAQFLKVLATRAVTVGQSTFGFVMSLAIMLYLLFFLLRDGPGLRQSISNAIPLRATDRDAILDKFVVVVRAIVKGSILVAVLQGALGGLIFWILGINAPVLWGVLMALLSLLPAVGAAVVWLPVAIYLLASGSVWQGAVLMAFGVLVIGLVDNLLRPLLVGKSTRIPDYVVLISTLGGIAVFGLNGFVIGPTIAALFIAVWDIFSRSRESFNPVE